MVLLFSFEVFERAGLGRINPINGAKRLFGYSQLIETLKGFIKIFGFCLAVFLIFASVPHDFVNMPLQPFSNQQEDMIFYVILVVVAAIATMIPVSIIDYIYQNWNHQRNLRMTPQEVKQEHKDEQGDPEIKGRIRQIRFQRMKEMMAAAVQRSDVLVTNPTTFSVCSCL